MYARLGQKFLERNPVLTGSFGIKNAFGGNNSLKLHLLQTERSKAERELGAKDRESRGPEGIQSAAV